MYKHSNKAYLKECCLESYLVGTHNHYLSHTQKQVICSTYRPARFKTLVVGSVQCKVFELKANKCLTIKGTICDDSKTLKVCRSIALHDVDTAYQICTSTELKKLTKAISNATDVDMDNDGLNSYVYLLRDRTAIATNDLVFKVGKTTMHNFERFKSYPKGFKVYLLIACTNCHAVEASILQAFRAKYISRLDYDTESFEGDPRSMVIDITSIVSQAY